MTQINAFVRPGSLHEAWTLLQQGGRAARLMGGGIDMAWLAPAGVETLIDLGAVTGRAVRWQDGELSIGTGATLSEVLESTEAAQYAGGILRTVLRRVASPLQRNAATLGGAIASAHPWSDVLTLLLALDARAVRYVGRKEVCEIETLIAEKGTIDRSILTEVLLPATDVGAVIAFDKLSRTGFDIGIINCACRVTQVEGRCQAVRVVMGGTPGISSRLRSAETLLMGEVLCESVIEQAAAAAAEEIPARDDLRASAAYRRVLAGSLVRECLGQILRRSGEDR